MADRWAELLKAGAETALREDKVRRQNWRAAAARVEELARLDRVNPIPEMLGVPSEPAPDEPLTETVKRKTRAQWGAEGIETAGPVQARAVIPPPIVSVSLLPLESAHYGLHVTVRLPGERDAKQFTTYFSHKMSKVLDYPDLLKSVAETVLREMLAALSK